MIDWILILRTEWQVFLAGLAVAAGGWLFNQWWQNRGRIRENMTGWAVRKIKGIEPVRVAYDYARELETSIHSLENHHTNPEGIFWIGQTLVECRSILQRKSIDGPANLLVDELLNDNDEDDRSQMGVFNVFISPKKVANLIDQFKELTRNPVNS